MFLYLLIYSIKWCPNNVIFFQIKLIIIYNHKMIVASFMSFNAIEFVLFSLFDKNIQYALHAKRFNLYYLS